MVKAYYKRLTGQDEKVRAEAGRAWVSRRGLGLGACDEEAVADGCLLARCSRCGRCQRPS